MKRLNGRTLVRGILLCALLTSGPVRADVAAGVDAWVRGDYSAAVREWQVPAAAGDVDAIFNLAQAYRLGRGVPEDAARAEELYARAAATGHLRSADTYGLMLFQDGRREAALPYIQDAARRGDPRSAYLLGLAHFNGDIVPRDWVRAYALLTVASNEGLPHAAPALAQMNEHIPLAERQEASRLAVELQRQYVASGRDRLVTEPADDGSEEPGRSLPVIVAQLPQLAASASSPAARTPITALKRPGTESSTQEGGAANSAADSVVSTLPQGSEARVGHTGSSQRQETPARTWRVQLGAFAVEGNAERLWSRLGGRSEFSGKAHLMETAGKLTMLQVGDYHSRVAAEGVCRSLKNAGQECLVIR